MKHNRPGKLGQLGDLVLALQRHQFLCGRRARHDLWLNRQELLHPSPREQALSVLYAWPFRRQGTENIVHRYRGDDVRVYFLVLFFKNFHFREYICQRYFILYLNICEYLKINV